MANYTDSNFNFLGFPMGFQRDLGFALDRSEVFDSYEDAVKYATGTLVDAEKDKRKLAPTSYVGQKISVVTTDSVAVYVIDTDRTLRRLDVQAVEVDGAVIVTNQEGKLTLNGAEGALTKQVFGKLDNGTFGFMDMTGGGGGSGDSSIISVGVGAGQWEGDTPPYTFTIPYSEHMVDRDNLLIHIYQQDGNVTKPAEGVTYAINENGDIILSSQTKQNLVVKIAGGVAESNDPEARQQLITAVTLEGNILTLKKANNETLTCDLSSLTPNITSTGSTLTITKASGSINIELANADQYLKKTDIGSTAGKIVALGDNDKIPSEYIGDLFITDVFTVVNKSDLITLSNAKQGDIALVQETLSKTTEIYILKTNPYSTIDNWVQMIIPCNVLSVNGKTGVVVIGIDDIAGLRNELNKIGATLTADKIVITDADGKLVSSTVAASELAKLAKIPVDFDASAYEVISNRTDTIEDSTIGTKYASVAAIKAYVTSRIQGHTHNGTDSPKIAFGNLTGTENIATKTDVSDAITAHNNDPTAHATLFGAKQNKVILLQAQTLASATWGSEKGTSGYYEYVFGNAAIKTNTKVDIVPATSSIETILAAGILPTVESDVGTVTIYAQSIPTADITVDMYLTEINE